LHIFTKMRKEERKQLIEQMDKSRLVELASFGIDSLEESVRGDLITLRKYHILTHYTIGDENLTHYPDIIEETMNSYEEKLEKMKRYGIPTEKFEDELKNIPGDELKKFVETARETTRKIKEHM